MSLEQTSVGVLGGTGPAGTALAARLSSIGYNVVIGSRSSERAEEKAKEIRDAWPALNLPLRGGSNEEAAACEIVVLATPWDSAATTVREHLVALRGKVVISMANALVRVGHEFQPLVPPRGSVAAHVQAAAPDCHVVAAFHHLPAKELGHLGDPIDSDVLIAPTIKQQLKRSVKWCDAFQAVARSTPANYLMPPPSRPSLRCCCNLMFATKPELHQSSTGSKEILGRDALI